MLIKGVDLTPDQRKQVFAAFIYRWTVENRDQATRAYAHSGFDIPKMTPVDDEQWLTHYAFAFIKDGSRLSCNQTHCVPMCLAEGGVR